MFHIYLSNVAAKVYSEMGIIYKMQRNEELCIRPNQNYISTFNVGRCNSFNVVQKNTSLLCFRPATKIGFVTLNRVATSYQVTDKSLNCSKSQEEFMY
ncbi:hypothetical protein SAMN05444682_10853 [Parapedobacter indicus]|uniref:Uncharacterized protein n=1 Tax=Parapedobacter indicus TaxID=1477437 RepID=A0A1I3PI66_9SPHI|nr:hypothetical protein CLV26_10853 [Parapedobacter indicus]SFJ21081.1 hypothetical protein SAMN05444682_10853 [Parapedobacter indicus]